MLKGRSVCSIASGSESRPWRPHRRVSRAGSVLAALALGACDPVIDIAGANFPAWLICVIAGVALAAGLRTAFAAIGIEPHLGPLTIVYPCLALLLSCLVWVIFFNRI